MRVSGIPFFQKDWRKELNLILLLKQMLTRFSFGDKNLNICYHNTCKMQQYPIVIKELWYRTVGSLVIAYACTLIPYQYLHTHPLFVWNGLDSWNKANLINANMKHDLITRCIGYSCHALNDICMVRWRNIIGWGISMGILKGNVHMTIKTVEYFDR